MPNNITAGSSKSVYWICSKCGYKWKAKVLNRALLKRGCPCCSNRVVVAGINDLATSHPKLAAEWDYEKNGDLTPQKVTHGSGKKVFWKCPIGHSYRASILHRSSGTNCPICNSGRQTSFAEQALFFYIKKIHPDAINRYNEIFENRRMEVDIYIPSMKTAIEYDGAFWHKNKRKLEEEKYKICRQKGIKLIRLCPSLVIASVFHHFNLFVPRKISPIVNCRNLLGADLIPCATFDISPLNSSIARSSLCRFKNCRKCFKLIDRL